MTAPQRRNERARLGIRLWERSLVTNLLPSGWEVSMHVAVNRPNLAGLVVFWGWSILVNARDDLERHFANRLTHPLGPLPRREPTTVHPRFVN